MAKVVFLNFLQFFQQCAGGDQHHGHGLHAVRHPCELGMDRIAARGLVKEIAIAGILAAVQAGAQGLGQGFVVGQRTAPQQL